MAFCPNCGKEVSPEAYACPNCGHPLKQPQPLSEPREHVSAAWWLLPIFLAWIGGLVGYLVLKDRNRSTAIRILIFGIVWTFVGALVVGVAVAGFIFGLYGTMSASSSVSVTVLACTHGTAVSSTCTLHLQNGGNAPASAVACSLGGASSTLTGSPLAIPAGTTVGATCTGASEATVPGAPVQGTLTLSDGIVIQFSGTYT
ncbi:MAG TPA: zinc-ribbon domain-containing protein [Nitrososphaerales archaeon]|nr:zinc-ribbon domain-containing protein [Nitrososphaerales archaeon]